MPSHRRPLGNGTADPVGKKKAGAGHFDSALSRQLRMKSGGIYLHKTDYKRAAMTSMTRTRILVDNSIFNISKAADEVTVDPPGEVPFRNKALFIARSARDGSASSFSP